MLSGEAAFAQIGELLLAAILTRFQQHGISAPERVGLVPAPIVWDDCQCGQLAVTTPRIYGSAAPPLEGPAGGPTGAPVPTEALPWPPFLVGEYQAAVLRCATTDPVPTTRVLQAEFQAAHRDAYWTLVAVACELHRLLELEEIVDYQLGDQPFLPAQGGCQGAQLNLTVTVPFWCPCPQEATP
jgi:hypothetical protein